MPIKINYTFHSKVYNKSELTACNLIFVYLPSYTCAFKKAFKKSFLKYMN